MAEDSAVRIELGKSFHQEGTFHLKLKVMLCLFGMSQYSDIHLQKASF